MSNRTLELTEELHAYVLEVSLRESEIARRLREETASLESASMQIAPEQGQFMAFLLELLRARRVLEIGTFTGYSALCMAAALPEGGHLLACDVSEEWTAIAQRYWREAGVMDKIELRLGPALATLDALVGAGEAETFDFVFIDADKQSYDAYYETALVLLRRDGLVAIDNVLWDGKVADPTVLDADTEALRRLNHKLHHDPRISLSLVPIADGLTLARKR